jgi:hypothetical protein
VIALAARPLWIEGLGVFSLPPANTPNFHAANARQIAIRI